MIPYWITALKRKHNSAQYSINLSLDTNFPFLVNRVKELLRPEKPLVFERNFKTHPSGSLVTVHAFLGPSVYLNLDCDGAYCYQMEYWFDHCLYEQEIRVYMRELGLHDKAYEKKRWPDFDTFFHKVLHHQGRAAFYRLGLEPNPYQ
ncbi:hypothetical protein LLH06_16670 [Mucilaginibacter daejeonensis]|uniref:hypothetical protein n=1 Tax=Mucilaginibacter daejeonensis TaxID=398049 RepID=UPI001D177537|nr:hypothetical protein [Mucilaginibacter daejeonensis]UEG52590.1 hypothetical protein LLH06_16670 [Mucilaginibacter daejeonensis]